MNIIDWIEHEMAIDDEDRHDQSRRLLDLYASAGAAEKRAIDDALICLCGWSMESAINGASPQ